MKNQQLLSYGAAWLALGGMCLPTPLAAGNEVVASSRTTGTASRSAVKIHDVALRPGGLLVGQLLDERMQPLGGTRVAIRANGQTAADTKTDANGVFAVAGLRGGVHEVVAGESTEVCRLWAPGTAPPEAESHLRYIPGKGDLVRGQWGPPPSYISMKDWITNPWVVGGIVVTAVGVPVLLNNLDDDDDDDDGS
jgi:hypothetical protein